MEENNVKGNNVNPAPKKGKSWKGVTLGGFPGILLGVGAIAGAQVFAKKVPFVNTADGKGEAEAEAEAADAVSPEVKEEKELTFEEAFNEAREEQGPDGVFEWNGGVYSTHTQEEMEAMTPEEQQAVVDNSGVEIPADQIETLPTDDNPAVMNTNGGAEESAGTDAYASNLESGDDDVHVVGVSEYEGHSMAQVDLDNDGYSDVSVVDMDDDGQLSGADLMMDEEGNMATLAELSTDSGEGEDSEYVNMDGDSTYENTDELASSGDDSFLDNPEVAEDMPDYMNDAIV